jgi:hypothetical protein
MDAPIVHSLQSPLSYNAGFELSTHDTDTYEVTLIDARCSLTGSLDDAMN